MEQPAGLFTFNHGYCFHKKMTTAPKAPTPSLAATLATHFAPAASRVTPSLHGPGWMQLAFGRNVSDQELAALCGAPTGSSLTMSRSPIPPPSQFERTPDGVKVTVRNATYFECPTELIFHRRSGNKCSLYIKLVATKKHPAVPNAAAVMMDA